ncbi:MAG: DUF563 domain-containing protein [Nitrospinae bacterium]|nr:DUF563 domain-containing protein [Nitrospinota bacterium]
MNDRAKPSVEADDLIRLATLLRNRSRILRQLEARRRVRKNERLQMLGVGFRGDLDRIIEKNRNLIMFLLRSALDINPALGEASALLAELHYEAGETAEALELIERSRAFPGQDHAMTVLYGQALLETHSSEALPYFARIVEADTSALELVRLFDVHGFDQWSERVGGRPVGLGGADKDVVGSLRVSLEGTVHEIDNTFRQTPLVGAAINDLEIVGGVVPVVEGQGYYDLAHLSGLAGQAGVTGRSRTAIVARNDIPKVTIEEPCILAMASPSYYQNYFHAIGQIYARIVMALDHLPDADSYSVLLPSSTPTWGRTFLEMVGIPAERLRFIPVDRRVVVKKALVLPMKWDVCPSEIEALRARLTIRFPYQNARRSYFLLRDGANNITRRLANEEDFIASARRHGFATLNPMRYTLPEQADLFRGTARMVIPASSAYANMVFAPPGGEVCMIAPRLFWGSLSSDLATSCSQRFSVIFGEYLAGSRNIASPHHAFVADPAALDRLLALSETGTPV